MSDHGFLSASELENFRDSNLKNRKSMGAWKKRARARIDVLEKALLRIIEEDAVCGKVSPCGSCAVCLARAALADRGRT